MPTRSVTLHCLLSVLLVACSETPLPTDPDGHGQNVTAQRSLSAASDIVGISAGERTLCALRSDDTFICAGPSTLVNGLEGSGYTQVSVSYQGATVCALKTDGNVACWGLNHQGQATPPAGPFTHISMGDFSACGLRPDLTVTCWGDPEGTNAPTDQFSTFDGGSRTYCGILLDQTLKCWGLNYQGSLAKPSGTFKQISVHALASCALRTDGEMFCWSGTHSGVAVFPGPFESIATSASMACGTYAATGIQECFGLSGPLPFWDWIPETQVGPIAAALYYACGVTQGQLGCWGQDNGQTGITDAPVIGFGGPYVIDEGTTLTVSAEPTADPNGAPLSFTWLTNNDRVELGTGPTLSYTFPNSFNTSFIVVADNGSSRVWRTVTVTVKDVKPGATLIAPATVEPGAVFELQLTNVVEPSPLDSNSMRAAFDCGAGTFTTGPLRVYSRTCTAPATRGTIHVLGRLLNSDGSSPIYTLDVQVGSNLAPAATLSAPAAVSEGSDIVLSLIDVSDEDPGSLAYAFDCGDGYAPFGASTSTNCSTSDDGSSNVRAKVRDIGGLEAEYSATVSVTNVPPVVNVFDGATILAGETYVASGSFSGAAVDTWIATVDYGSGAQPLALVGSSYTLSHTYPVAGIYHVTVTVTDDDGSAASRSSTVTVESAQQAAQSLSSEIETLLTNNVIDQGAATAMTSKLAAASEQFASDNVNAGNNQLDAFIKQVEAQLRSGRLTDTQAQTLIDFANRIKQSAAS